MPPGTVEFVFKLTMYACAFGFPVLCLLMWRRSREVRRRWNDDLCPECGYDVRAPTGNCPECGYRIRRNA